MLWTPSLYLDALYGLARAPAMSREAIVAFQNRRLRSLIRHAYQNVPFQRKRFDAAGVRPEHIQTIDDIGRLPLTSRADVQAAAPEELCSRGVDPSTLKHHRTSGSTGAPLSIRRRALEERILLGHRVRRGFRNASEWRYRRALIKHHSDEAPEQDSTWSAVGRWLGIVHKRSYHYGQPKEELVRRLEAFRPHALGGPPGIMSWLAEEWTEEDRRRVPVQVMTSGAETLTPEMRARISEAFGAPIFDSYASHEFVSIALECAETGLYHIQEPCVLTEVLRDGRPVEVGEEGELVGTALLSHAMPFVRYRLGDLVVRGPDLCPCGARRRTLARIEGRIIDRFVLSSGRGVHPYEISVELRDGELAVRRFQIVQVERDQFEIFILAQGRPRDELLRETERRIAELLGGGVTIRIRLADDLPPGPTGKFYPYVSWERLQSWRASGQNLDAYLPRPAASSS